MRLGSEHFLIKDFAFIDAMVMPVLGLKMIAIYEVLRRHVWRSLETGSKRSKKAYREGKLTTTVCQRKICALTGLSRRQVQIEIKRLRKLGWVQSQNGTKNGTSVLHVLGVKHDDGTESFFADGELRSLWLAMTDVAVKEGWSKPIDLSCSERLSFTREWYASKLGEEYNDEDDNDDEDDDKSFETDDETDETDGTTDPVQNKPTLNSNKNGVNSNLDHCVRTPWNHQNAPPAFPRNLLNREEWKIDKSRINNPGRINSPDSLTPVEREPGVRPKTFEDTISHSNYNSKNKNELSSSKIKNEILNVKNDDEYKKSTLQNELSNLKVKKDFVNTKYENDDKYKKSILQNELSNLKMQDSFVNVKNQFEKCLFKNLEEELSNVNVENDKDLTIKTNDQILSQKGLTWFALDADSESRLERGKAAEAVGKAKADKQREQNVQRAYLREKQKKLVANRTDQVEKDRKREQRASNLKGRTYTNAVVKAARNAWDVYISLVSDNDMPKLKWGASGNAKARGQLCQLVDTYGGEATLIGIRYMVINWDLIRRRYFKDSSGGLPSLGLLYSLHEPLFREAMLWVCHYKTLEEWNAWFAEHAYDSESPPSDLQSRYEKAQEALAALGFGC